MTDSIDRLVRAVRIKGANPDYHDRKLHELSREWPELYDAVMAIVREREARELEAFNRAR